MTRQIKASKILKRFTVAIYTPYQSDVSVSRLETALHAVINVIPISELKRPTAAAKENCWVIIPVLNT